MKIKFLLLGTSLSFIPLTVNAQCVATQDCATLGYTETSCNGGKGVKCPFGNKWACLTSENECLKIACEKLGFQHTCSGTGYSSGSGDNCNGKYKKCNCSNGYEWKENSCKLCSSSYQYTCTGKGYDGGSGSSCSGKYTTCKCISGYKWKDEKCQEYKGETVGDLYYCDGKIVAVKVPDANYFIGMKDLGYMDWDSANNTCQNYSFCGNIKGQLPTSTHLENIYKNKSTINNILSTNGGTKLTNKTYWSSSSYHNMGSGYREYVNMSNGIVSHSSGQYPNYVRPIVVPPNN